VTTCEQGANSFVTLSSAFLLHLFHMEPSNQCLRVALRALENVFVEAQSSLTLKPFKVKNKIGGKTEYSEPPPDTDDVAWFFDVDPAPFDFRAEACRNIIDDSHSNIVNVWDDIWLAIGLQHSLYGDFGEIFIDDKSAFADVSLPISLADCRKHCIALPMYLAVNAASLLWGDHTGRPEGRKWSCRSLNDRALSMENGMEGYSLIDDKDIYVVHVRGGREFLSTVIPNSIPIHMDEFAWRAFENILAAFTPFSESRIFQKIALVRNRSSAGGPSRLSKYSGLGSGLSVQGEGMRVVRVADIPLGPAASVIVKSADDWDLDIIIVGGVEPPVNFIDKCVQFGTCVVTVTMEQLQSIAVILEGTIIDDMNDFSARHYARHPLKISPLKSTDIFSIRAMKDSALRSPSKAGDETAEMATNSSSSSGEKSGGRLLLMQRDLGEAEWAAAHARTVTVVISTYTSPMGRALDDRFVRCLKRLQDTVSIDETRTGPCGVQRGAGLTEAVVCAELTRIEQNLQQYTVYLEDEFYGEYELSDVRAVLRACEAAISEYVVQIGVNSGLSFSKAMEDFQDSKKNILGQLNSSTKSHFDHSSRRLSQLRINFDNVPPAIALDDDIMDSSLTSENDSSDRIILDSVISKRLCIGFVLETVESITNNCGIIES
jgi:hypothetical protein